MATLQLENGTTYTTIQDIELELARLGIRLNRWAIADDPSLANRR